MSDTSKRARRLKLLSLKGVSKAALTRVIDECKRDPSLLETTPENFTASTRWIQDQIGTCEELAHAVPVWCMCLGCFAAAAFNLFADHVGV